MTKTQDPVAEWMDQLGFSKGKSYYTHRETEMDISDDEATFFYREYLKGRIDELKAACTLYRDTGKKTQLALSKDILGAVIQDLERRIAELEAQLQLMEE